MSTTSEMLGIHHVSISGSDFGRSKAFYARCLVILE
jgi:catechol 2,3-dioxygenase-like lactoylglutathione lyase family enzyme